MNYKLNFLKNKKIAVLGLGIENLALVKYILKHKIKCQITVCDKRDKRQLSEDNRRLPRPQRLACEAGGLRSAGSGAGVPRPDIKWQLGRDYNKNLDKFDVFLRSPGWPMDCPVIVKTAIHPSSPMKLFFELCPTKNIIGVTGAKGKGTTASLIYEILRAAGKRVWLGGNIGVAPFAFIDKIKKNDWVVLELSSFQLEDMTASPPIAVITNFFPEHLAPADPNNQNYHKTVDDYWRAKMNITRWQKRGDYLITNYELRITNYGLRNKIYTFSAKNQKANCFWLDENKIKCHINTHNSSFIIHTSLLGEHNKENIAAAVEVAKLAGVKREIIKKAVAGFKGLEHRLEFVREVKGVKYYNDSFATAPEATLTALKAFSAPVVLFLGGADKNSDFSELAEEVKRRTKFVILLKGQATARIKKELLRAGYEKNKIKLFNKIDEAVKFAKKIAVRGELVLLSTACASFGMFKNYKERGKLFKAAVKKLPVK